MTKLADGRNVGIEGLHIVFDAANRVIEINGIRYHADLFKALGVSGLPEGAVLRIEKREDGVVTLTRLNGSDSLSVGVVTQKDDWRERWEDGK